MRFTETEIAGVVIVDLEPIEDDRGWFARSYCRDEFLAHGLDPTIVQCNVSVNRHAGTIRGMHYQIGAHAETKLVRCVRGAVHDVVVDLRPGFADAASGTSPSSCPARPTAPCTSRRVSPTASRRSWTTPKSNTVWALRTRRRQGGAYDSTIRRSGCGGRYRSRPCPTGTRRGRTSRAGPEILLD